MIGRDRGSIGAKDMIRTDIDDVISTDRFLLACYRREWEKRGEKEGSLSVL